MTHGGVKVGFGKSDAVAGDDEAEAPSGESRCIPQLTANDAAAFAWNLPSKNRPNAKK